MISKLANKIKINDLSFSIIFLLFFSSLFLVCNYYVSRKGPWQRYQIHILIKTNNLICDLCGKAEYSGQIIKFFTKANPMVTVSSLSPIWPNSKSRLVSFSVFSSREIELQGVFEAVLKYEKCQGELLKVDDIGKYKIEGMGRRDESNKKCKVYFIYERKL